MILCTLGGLQSNADHICRKWQRRLTFEAKEQLFDRVAGR